jgi:putative SOS response-associated peptidase YedK
MRTINCRDDSLIENRGMWTSMKKRKRCVVVCHGFYEWLKKNEKEKIPHYIKRKDGKLLLFAGLWDVVHYDDSEEKNYTFTIITTDANKQMKPIHDRMPVILEPGSKELFSWLDPKKYEWSKELQSILKPWDGELEMYPVDQAVGKVGNNSPSFIVPINSTENKKHIANFFNNQAEKAKSPKKPIKVEEIKDQVKVMSPTESKTGDKRGHGDISDQEDVPIAKLAKKSEPNSSPSKRKMHSATRNGTAPKGSPKKADKSKKITNFFIKNSA